jgi:hypothetical protein
MNKYYSTVSFVKLYDDKKNVVRIVDIIQSNKSNEFINPDLFKYKFLLTTTGEYKSPVEYLNYDNVIDTLHDVFPSQPRTNIIYLTKSFLPQFPDTQDEINSTGSSLTVIKEDYVYNNIYFYSLPGEKYFKLFEGSVDFEDPYGIVDEDKVSSIGDYIELTTSNKSNLVMVGVDLEKGEEWEIINLILNSTDLPINNILYSGQQVSGSSTKLVNKKYIKENLETPYIEGTDELKIGNRIIKSSNIKTIYNKSTSLNPLNTLYNDPF